jgi:serine/threonine-protein kinase
VYCPICRSEYPADWKRCPKDEAALLRDSKVGKYRVEEVIGTGGMGAVYRAFNPDTQSAVAIKLMHAQAAAHDAARARFQREAAAVAALRTRHVVTIYDFGAETDGTLYLVMELLVGHTLRAEIQRPPALIAPARLHMIVDGALRGLGAAHRAGITHRDLKPENVFIATTDDGEVAKILDFGIARTSTKDQALTQSGALMGTPAYMAPEQVAGNRGAIGPSTDVYSMGVILYEALTGSSPFGAESVTEVLGRVLGRQFIPIAHVRPDLPPAIIAVVDRAMSDPPDQRFANADAMRDAWLAAMGGTAATATERSGKHPRLLDHEQVAPTITPNPIVVDATIEDGKKKSRAWIWIALAILVAGGASAAIAAFTGSGGAKHAAAGSPGSIDAAPIASATIDASPPPDASQVAIAPPDAAPAPAPAPKDPDMVAFAGGAFTMGVDPTRALAYPDVDPAHPITIGAFLIDKHEVTLADFRAALGNPKAGGLTGDHADWPARYVTAAQAAAACKAMGKRLPTEAEWELAAHDGHVDAKAARLKGGADAPDAVATHPGDCTASGVCDLLGNVMEWTADPWKRPTMRKGRVVVRGGSFRVDPSDSFYATLDARVAAAPNTPDPELGFRCAKDATNKE